MIDSSFTSFDRSILHDLSKQSWRRGIVNFFSESIPFSFSSGNEYADLVVELFQVFSTYLNQSLNVVEFGAGNGVFAKKCIQKLVDKDCSFHYLVTENVVSLVNHFDHIDRISQSHNVDTRVLDIYDFTLEQPFHMGILTYLLDTCPVKIMELKDGALHEWLVSVSVKHDSTLTLILDGEFVVWEKKDIETFLSQPIKDDHLSVLSRIHDCLDIRWKLSKCNAAELDSTGILDAWLAKQASSDQGVFTFSSSWWTILDSLRYHVADPFMLVLYDFASIQSTQFKTYLESFGQFGICYFYSVSFFLFEQYCRHHDMQFISSQFPDSDNQIAVMTSLKSGVFNNEVVSLFDRTEPGKVVYEYALMIQQANSLEGCLALIRQAKECLTCDQQSDYVFLFSIASTLYDFKCYDQVIFYVDFILKDYGQLSLNAILLKSKALRKNGFIHDALTLVESGIKHAPTYDLFYLEKAFIAQELNQLDLVKDALIGYFDTVMANPQWHLLDLLKKL